MAYNAKKRDIIGTIWFFALGLLIGGFASMIAIVREWLQYKQNGVLESNDVMRYVIVSSVGAVIQLLVVLTWLILILKGK